MCVFKHLRVLFFSPLLQFRTVLPLFSFVFFHNRSSSTPYAAAPAAPAMSPEDEVYFRWTDAVMKVVAERKLQMRTVFARMDTNSDNFLNRKEFVEGLKYLGVSSELELWIFVTK